MSLEEKLEYFKEIILKDATSERDKKLASIKTQIEERLCAEKAKCEQQADDYLKREMASAKSLKNGMLSRAIMESRQLLMRAREEIMEEVYKDVKEKLLAFIHSEEYLPYLLDMVRYSCKTAGEGELTVYINKSDMELLSPVFEGLKNDLPLGTTFEAASDDILGGCLVINRTKDIMVNNTLAQKLEASKDHFFEASNLRIE
jgi:V/A-type H+-transporting ATPase subunit E